ncbi:hypothetical protein NE237_025485 [Protea cynaroides]|uniref:Uncharacterized protein n=1 Tax=Protea cynaroides TaxID=273540 RepID=A0A9Q0H749_9MAGN|nr:hypothetical protein NE237_025485 [Protea cynaroides]
MDKYTLGCFKGKWSQCNQSRNNSGNSASRSSRHHILGKIHSFLSHGVESFPSPRVTDQVDPVLGNAHLLSQSIEVAPRYQGVESPVEASERRIQIDGPTQSRSEQCHHVDQEEENRITTAILEATSIVPQIPSPKLRSFVVYDKIRAKFVRR